MLGVSQVDFRYNMNRLFSLEKVQIDFLVHQDAEENMGELRTAKGFVTYFDLGSIF